MGKLLPASKLLSVGRDVIRRYHGTKTKYADNIAKEGLKVNPPEYAKADWAPNVVNLPDYPGIYTTVHPEWNYFDAESPSNALVVLDIPKDWYRQATRLPYNPEWPKPAPKLKRWDAETLDMADEAYYAKHGDEPGWHDFPSQVLEDYYTIVPIQQGGRVDIFKQDIPKEFINEIFIPKGDDTYKTIIKPNRNIDWWNFDFFDDL